MEWQRDTSVGCSDEDQDSTTITDGSTSYTIGGLEEDSRYTITVTASNTLGGRTSNQITPVTLTAGEYSEMLRCGCMIVVLSAPTAAPLSVTTSTPSSSTISVQWGSVPCIHQNGDITGYSVQYEVMGSGNTQIEMISGDSSGGRMTTISGLTPSTTYSIEVAAVNSAGTGVYSDPTNQLTQGLNC